MKSPNRIDVCFATLKRQRQKAFVAYITAGDPDLSSTRRLVSAMEKSGVNVLELGVPFSDPLADGVVNQQAADRALKAGTTLKGVLGLVRQLRKDGVKLPLVLFTYFNPIHHYGIKKFVRDAALAGVDGVLNLDLPPEESGVFEEEMGKKGIHSVRLVAPTTPPDRIRKITRRAGGFIYYVSREGVTGMQKSVASGIKGRIAEIHRHTGLPVVVGFGISKPDQVRMAARFAEGCVVGSAIVDRIGKIGKKSSLVPRVSGFVRQLTHALKKG